MSIRSNEGNGTGIAWDEHGHIVTAYHVVRHLQEVEVTSDNGRSSTARVVGRDRSSDIAILQVDNHDLTPIKKGDSESLKVGQFVLALANPFGQKASATSGIITGVRRNIGGWWGVQVDEAVVTDARLNPGYSGGPLVDANGSMVGLNVAVVSSRGIAIPVKNVSEVVDRVLSGKPMGRAYLGIVSNPVPLPEKTTKVGNVKQDYGLLILSVEPESPADKAGLLLGDVLLRFGQSQVAGLRDLTHALTQDAVGKSIDVQILRGGKVEQLVIVPSTAPESD